MARPDTGTLIWYLRGMLATWKEDARNDAELLAIYACSHDETAFITLVGRHGPLVWSICCRILDNTADAEDAFQATFLDLARKVRHITNLSGWLSNTAQRRALDVRRTLRRQQQRERQLAERTQAPTSARTEEEALLREVLEEELARLPEKYRIPLLCYREGKTFRQMAEELGCSPREITRRLAKGEELLRQQLRRQGLPVPAVGGLAALLSATAEASNLPVPPQLVANTLRAAKELPASGVGDLVRAVLHNLGLGSGWKLGLGLMLLTGIGAIGVGLVSWQASDKPGTVTGQEKSANDALGPHVSLPRNPQSTLPTPPIQPRTRPWQHDGAVTAVAYAPDGKTFASSGSDGTVRLWDAQTGEEKRRWKGPAQGTTTLTFSPDGKYLATEGVNGRAWLWSLEVNTKDEWVEKKTKSCAAVAFSSDGTWLAMLEADQKLVILNLTAPAGNRIWQNCVPIRSEVGDFKIAELEALQVRRHALVFSSDSSEIYWANDRPEAGLFTKPTGERDLASFPIPLRRVQPPVTALAFAPNGCYFAWADSSHKIKWIDLNNKTPKDQTQLRQRTFRSMALIGHQADVSALAFSADGQWLASADLAGEIRIWSEKSWDSWGKKEGRRHLYYPLSQSVEGIRALAFTPDGKHLVTGSKDGRLRQWNFMTGQEVTLTGKR